MSGTRKCITYWEFIWIQNEIFYNNYLEKLGSHVKNSVPISSQINCKSESSICKYLTL